MKWIRPVNSTQSNPKPLVEGLVLKSCAALTLACMDVEAPRGGAGIEINMSSISAQNSEAPRGGAGIEIFRCLAPYTRLPKPLVEGLVLK